MTDRADAPSAAGVASLDDVLAIERIPYDRRDAGESTHDMLSRAAAAHGSRPALTFFLRTKDFRRPHTWTHSQFIAQVNRVANTLRKLGIGRDETVALILPNLPETHFAIWGGEAAGIAMPLNPLLEARQLGALMASANARVLVTISDAPGTDIWRKSVEALRFAPCVETVLAVDLGRYVGGWDGVAFGALSRLARMRSPKAEVRVLDFHEAISDAPDELAFAPPSAGDIASCFCTGGTTGLPKLARRTHGCEVYNAWAITAFVYGIDSPPRTGFCGLPLFHVNSQIVMGLGPLSRGGHVILATAQGYRAPGLLDRFWEVLGHHRADAFSGVPTVYSVLLNKMGDGEPTPPIDFAFCGAAPMPVEVFREFGRRTGVRILEGYGLTEGGCVSSINPPRAPARIGSIGLRLPYQDMRIVVLDEGGEYLRDAARDEPGVVAIRGPNVFAGYLDPAHDRDVWIERNGERWLNTGDLGRQDADGYFWLVGRRKELIIRGGHNIDPRVIEEPAHAHPAVALAAAVGRPDPHAGEVPVLHVERKPGVSVTGEELEAFLRAHIVERAAWPRHVRIRDRLPVTAIGKIHKPTLALYEVEDVVRGELAKADATARALVVKQDLLHGVSVRIELEADRPELARALGRYTFHWSIDDKPAEAER